MLIEDLLGNHRTDQAHAFRSIRTSCSQFIDESAGLPLFRQLPTSYADVHRVKVRAKKTVVCCRRGIQQSIRAELHQYFSACSVCHPIQAIF